MTGKQIAELLNARRSGKGRWMSRCPSHDDRSPSLGIYEGKKAVLLTCYSHGCDIADICKAIGIRVADLWYESRTRQDPKEAARLAKVRHQEEATEYRGRIRNWIILFKNEGYSDTQREDDTDVAIACATMLAGGYDKEHIRRMLRNAMERITAASIMRMADARNRHNRLSNGSS